MPRYLLVALAATCCIAAAHAQTTPAAPPAGSGGGGPVGESVSEPRAPQGTPPPGTPAATGVDGQAARNAAGTAIIGRTATPGAGSSDGNALPGATDGADSGVRR